MKFPKPTGVATWFGGYRRITCPRCPTPGRANTVSEPPCSKTAVVEPAAGQCRGTRVRMFWPALALVAMVTAFGFVRLAAAMAAVLTAMHLIDRLQAAARQSKNTR